MSYRALGELKPTQADRNAAADYGKTMNTLTGRERDAVLRGKMDAYEIVQWHARRREALSTPPRDVRPDLAAIEAGLALASSLSMDVTLSEEGQATLRAAWAAFAEVRTLAFRPSEGEGLRRALETIRDYDTRKTDSRSGLTAGWLDGCVRHLQAIARAALKGER